MWCSFPAKYSIWGTQALIQDPWETAPHCAYILQLLPKVLPIFGFRISKQADTNSNCKVTSKVAFCTSPATSGAGWGGQPNFEMAYLSHFLPVLHIQYTTRKGEAKEPILLLFPTPRQFLIFKMHISTTQFLHAKPRPWRAAQGGFWIGLTRSYPGARLHKYEKSLEKTDKPISRN
ncbi:hypothetical protein SCHPADRAFT_897282 [Schizopora paradoxa]|uniref:Uncharacterized protein n=1 Tax=Schizopora paradoxa TaxID=27342 RepID=A0A0H2QX11_9AGAM|nr:hypothetical protein SCHPADRAFT_897282 [Schizopora paradoxa]